MKAVKESGEFSEKEDLNFYDRFNDLILTSLRTYWGLNLKLVQEQFGEDLYQYCLKRAEKYLKSNHIRKENNALILSDEGVFISNDIMSDFFYIEED